MVQIDNDFGGFPVEAMTLREILNKLGFKNDGTSFSIDNDNPILDAYPYTLEDDGMGYGVNPKFIMLPDKDIYKRKVKTIEYEVGENKKLDIFPYEKVVDVDVFNLFLWDVPVVEE